MVLRFIIGLSPVDLTDLGHLALNLSNWNNDLSSLVEHMIDSFLGL